MNADPTAGASARLDRLEEQARETQIDALRQLHRDHADPPAELIGYLPKVSCRQCSQNSAGHCDKHQKIRCPKCGAWISQAHVDVEFVGHADVTRILLEADPQWNWEPVAWNADGEPLIVKRDRDLRMWGRLTVHGVTRLGVGTVAADSFDAEKQLIGDMIRNAAMRFGVAVGLWSKGDRAEVTAALEATEPTPPPAPMATQEQADIITGLADRLSPEDKAAMRAWTDGMGFDLKRLTLAQADELIGHLEEVITERGPAAAQPSPGEDYL